MQCHIVPARDDLVSGWDSLQNPCSADTLRNGQCPSGKGGEKDEDFNSHENIHLCVRRFSRRWSTVRMNTTDVPICSAHIHPGTFVNCQLF